MYYIIMSAMLFMYVIGIAFVINRERGIAQKRIRELEEIMAAYDRSEKVIKDCVVYTPDMPVTVSASNTSFIGCTFENLGKKQPTGELKAYLGLKA